ncbi:MAG: AAA family ATPase [Chloroflexi bacterium]|nr:AAA family ATPase [Chloroflexota bacterium]
MITTAPLEDLACYVPALILRRVSGDSGATMAPALERFPAAVLFTDLSGFTALTERLTSHSPAGAEELTRLLDGYFGRLVDIVTSHGGDVVKFAGDGLLALWYGEEPLAHLARRAVQCGHEVQRLMTPDSWRTFTSSAPPLALRVGVGAGEVTTMHLGGSFGRWELLVAGEAIVQTSRAEAAARPGEVLIAPDAWPLVAGACLGQPLPSGAVRLAELVEPLPPRPLQLPAMLPAMAEALRAYLPKAILARLDAGQSAWLAEQRPVTVLFVNLPDLQASTSLRDAQTLMRALQTALYRYQGSITRLGTDAKGPTLVAALGLPPFAHEDDPERGVRAAWDMHRALRELGFAAAIGITSGRALCATVGGLTRREYTMMGAIVNRSARLMQAAAAAAPGALPILCDGGTFHGARGRLRFDALPPLALKGVAEPVPVYRPTLDGAPGAETIAADRSIEQDQGQALLGRERELALIAARVDHLVQHGRGGVIIIEGEAGIGKSLLLRHTRTLAAQRGAALLHGAGSPVEVPPYHPWRPVVAGLIGHDPSAPLAEAVRRALTTIDAVQLAPLLNAVLPLDLPETPVSAQRAAQLRTDQTHDLIVRLLERATEQAPLVLMLDNLQWFDARSWALLRAVAERLGRLLLIAALRPLNEAPPIFQRLVYRPDGLRLQLRGLAAEALRTLLAQRLGGAALPEEAWRAIAERAQGNPFVAEELLRALRASGALVVADGRCWLASGQAAPAQVLAGARLPESVQGLLTSRIDRLTPAQQLTLKVASVIGPVFPLAVLVAVHPAERRQEQLVDQLFALQQAGLVVMQEFEPELVYAFSHVVGCEVAYNLMSFAQRQRLHRSLAEYYEAHGNPGLAPALLAQHWRQAGEPLRALRTLALAGEQALANDACSAAATLLGEALTLATSVDRAAPGAPTPEELARWQRALDAARQRME